MARLDRLLFWLFLILLVAGVGWSVFALRQALRYSSPKKDPDGIRMFFWACAGLAGLVLAAMSLAYFLFPIISHYFFSPAE